MPVEREADCGKWVAQRSCAAPEPEGSKDLAVAISLGRVMLKVGTIKTRSLHKIAKTG